MAGKRRSVITIETHKLTVIRRSGDPTGVPDLGGRVDEVIETEKKQISENVKADVFNKRSADRRYRADKAQ